MRTTYLSTLWAILLLSVQSAFGQNTLVIPDVTVTPGHSFLLPVNLENKDEVVAVQFNLTLPSGITLDLSSPALTERANGHDVTIRKTGNNTYTTIIMSGQNKTINDNSGTLMNIELTANDSFSKNETLPMTVTNVVITDSEGNNIAKGSSSGKIFVVLPPDLMVKDINCDKTSLNPGEQTTVSWQVENIGGQPTKGGWSEQVSLVSKDGAKSKLIATTHFDGILNTGSVEPRHAAITLPTLIGLEGQVRLQVYIVPDSDCGESPKTLDNNTITGGIITLSKVILLELTPNTVGEQTGTDVAFKVSRSGSWTKAETFTITATKDSRLSVPESVTIPANQSGKVVYIGVADNTKLDNDSLVGITVMGNGYPESTTTLKVIDDELPVITATAKDNKGKALDGVAEGDDFILHIEVQRAPKSNLTLAISSDKPKRFSYPTQFALKAGETSADIIVSTIDDNLSDIEQVATFSVTALGYEGTELVIALTDNDEPSLELTLQPSTVSEGAGNNAVRAILRRTSNIDKYATIHISDNSNGGLRCSDNSLVMEMGKEQVEFSLEPVDNELVDGNRTYTITAALYSSTCSCSATEHSNGYVTAVLNVLDNDGPTIDIRPELTYIKEGQSTSFTVTRNHKLNEAITVQMACDDESRVDFNHTVTIPANQLQTVVNVTFPNNDMTGDGKTVTFTASSDGFNTGTCAVFVTDQSLPDAVVAGLKADTRSIIAGEPVNLTYTVRNEGLKTLPETTDIMVFVEGKSYAAQKLGKALEPGESTNLTTTLNLLLNVGLQHVYVTANPNQTVSELSYANNNSQQIEIEVGSPFSVAEFKADKTTCEPGESVRLTGRINGTDEAIKKVDVEIYYIINGYRITKMTETDDMGQFSADIKLIDGLYGSYLCGVCYPNERRNDAMATINVFGLNVETGANPYISLNISETKTGRVVVHNPASVPLDNMKLTIGKIPENLTFKATVPDAIPAGESIEIAYAITGVDPSTGNDWQTIDMRLDCGEKASLQIPIKAYVYTGEPKLMIYSSSISLNLTQGVTTPYGINIKNGGKGETGTLHLVMPESDWITTPRTQLPSLSYDEELCIPVYFAPTTDLPLNSEYKTKFYIYGEKGGSLVIEAKLKVVSEKTGRVLVDAVDEGTFYFDEKPHVDSAFVQIMDPYSNQVVASGLTGQDGLFLSEELPCGTYACIVSKNAHVDFKELVYVEAAKVDTLEAFMAISPISYRWEVYPTSIEDKYEFNLVATYETHVPTPVVIIDILNEIPKEIAVGDTVMLMATVTNHGLVEAEDVNIHFSDHSLYKLETEVKHFDTIGPEVTKFVPVIMTRKTEPNETNVRGVTIGGCQISANMEMFAGCKRRCNYQTLRWDTIQVTKSFPVPVPDVSCEIPLPHIPSPAPFPIIVHPEPDLPRRAVPFGDGSGWKGSGWSETPLEFDAEEDLENCAADCWDDFNDNADDWKDRAKDLAEKAKKAAEKGGAGGAGGAAGEAAAGAATKAALGEAAAMWGAFKLGWDIGKWIDECLVPMVPGLWETLHGDGSGFDVNARSLRKANASNYNISVSEEQITNIANSYRMWNKLEFLMEANLPDEKIDSLVDAAIAQGYDGIFDEIGQGAQLLVNTLKDIHPGGCTKVKVQFTQTAVFAREAFQGVLTIQNTAPKPITDLELKFRVEDLNGRDCSSLFQIDPAYKLTDIDLDADGKGTIGAEGNGVYDILFIPTKYAASTKPVDYRFTGAITFTNPNSGVPYSQTLFPVTLTVNPTPEVDVHYFLQRDILGDDAMTEQVEPSIPSELSVLLCNKGYGDAENVRFEVKQPKIIENEKNLLIDFQITSASVNGQETTSIDVTKEVSTVNFGTIPAHSTSYAQWELVCSLLGHFADYDITYSHLNSYDNDSLSIIGDVAVHELIRSLNASMQDEGLKGFLVNDIDDANDEPETIYISDGTKKDVHQALDARMIKVRDNTYRLTVIPSTAGWNYKHILTPTGKQVVEKVVRMSDGAVMQTRNFWVTNVTINDILEPTYENRLHMAIDFMTDNEETYEITFSPRAEVVLEIETFEGVPEKNDVATEPVKSVTVRFNKPIDSKSFTADDIQLMVQGERQDISGIHISSINEQTFSIQLDNLPIMDGLHIMTVQTSGIYDKEGYAGETGKSVLWIEYLGEETSIAEISVISSGKSIYNLSGMLICPSANQQIINSLPHGIYIIEGKKYLVK